MNKTTKHTRRVRMEPQTQSISDIDERQRQLARRMDGNATRARKTLWEAQYGEKTYVKSKTIIK